jgi:hypothetical protein
MHQKTSSAGKISYYVSNFHNDNDAINNQNAIATVCMEYSPLASVSSNDVNVTKFFVFNGAGQLVNSANLDDNNFGPDNGQKFVPGLCITCHGGSGNLDYSTSNFLNSAALQTYFNGHSQEIPSFLPFDAKSFYYSTATGYTRIEQEENIRKLNNTILSVKNTQAIIDFVNASYNSQPGTVGRKYIDNAVVDKGGNTNTWNTATTVHGIKPTDFYVDIVGTSCRTCHISRTNPNIWFDTKQKFINKTSSINLFVCSASPNRFMPNSKVTYLNFWTSEAPVRSQQVSIFLNGNTTSCQ